MRTCKCSILQFGDIIVNFGSWPLLFADPSATGDVISQAIAKAQASGGIQGLASAFSQAIAQGGGGAAQALASGYAEAVGAGNTEATAQAIAAASAEVNLKSTRSPCCSCIMPVKYR
jgi:hypothetical protein